jgi:predicted CoA-binding protein
MVPAQRLHQNGQMEAQAMIDEFLLGETYAVAGASTDRGKYGNKVFRCYQQAGKAVIPLNPRADEVEGVECIRDLSELPVEVYGLSIITPPRVTETLVEEAARAGVKRLWVQPGAEFEGISERCEALGISCIFGGPCLLVVLGFREGD